MRRLVPLLDPEAARKNVNYLAMLDFTISLGFGLILPLFPVYVDELGGGGLEVGILFSSFVLTRAFLSTTFGNLSDRIGRKRLILIGTILYAILAILFTIPDSWFGLIFVRGFQGMASAMVWPVSEALVIDSTPPSQRGRSMGKIVMSSNLGFVVGPFVGGGLIFFAANYLDYSTAESYKFPFYFTAIISLVGAFLVWRYVTDAKSPDRKRARMRLGSLLRPEGADPAVLRNLKILYANAAIEGFSFSSIGPLMALFLVARFSLTADVISILVGVAMGLGALVAFPSGRMADRIGKKRLFVVGGYVAFVATILVPVTWALAVVVLLLAARSMAFQVSSPALRAMQADIVPENVRGRLIGLLESMSNFGAVLGAPLGGLLFNAYYGRDFGLPFGLDGTMVPFLVSGLLGIVAITMVHLYVRVPSVASE